MGQILTSNPERRKRHGSSPLPWFALGLSGLSLILFWLFGPLSEILVYDKEAIARGEVWRLVTGHLVHVSFSHMLLNVAALLPLAWFLEKGFNLSPAKMLLIFLTAIFAIDLWLFIGLPSLSFYSGLSAYLNTLYVLLMMLAWRQTGHKIFLLLLTGDALKIAYEGLAHSSIFTSLLWPPVPSAHAVGFAVGIALFFTLKPEKTNTQLLSTG